MQILVCDKEERDLIGAFYTLHQAHPRFDGGSMLRNDCDDERKIYMAFKRVSEEFHVFVLTHCFRLIKTSSF